MKQLLCKSANWILRKYTNPIIGFQEDLYINGRIYKLVRATTTASPYAQVITEFEVIGGR